MQKVKLLLQKCYICLTLGGRGTGLDATTKKDVQPSSPEAWRLKSNEEATAHWEYVKSVLLQHEVSQREIDNCGSHYKAAFQHGWKHGVEFINEY